MGTARIGDRVMSPREENDKVDTYTQGRRQTDHLVPRPATSIAVPKIFFGPAEIPAAW